jgi:hypothetical protein
VFAEHHGGAALWHEPLPEHTPYGEGSGPWPPTPTLEVMHDAERYRQRGGSRPAADHPPDQRSPPGPEHTDDPDTRIRSRQHQAHAAAVADLKATSAAYAQHLRRGVSDADTPPSISSRSR